MKHFRSWIIVGALAVTIFGIAAIASAQDATAQPTQVPTVVAPATQEAPADTPANEAPAPKAYLGVVFEAADGGVTVVEVSEGSPAAAAGIAAGDLITAINGTAVTEDNIRETIQAMAIGDTASVAVTRGTESLTLDVTLAAAPAELVRPGRQGRPNIEVFRASRPLLGIGIADSDAGVTITSVAAGSPAEVAGFAVDDVITAINGTAVATAEEAANAVAAAGDAAAVGDFTVTVGITRAGAAMDLTATLTKLDVPVIPDLPGMRGGRGDRGDRGGGMGFGFPGMMNIVPREGEEGKFDVVVPFTPADPAAVTQDVIDSLAAIGITITPRDGEEGVFDLTIPAESLDNGNFMVPDLQGMFPKGFDGMFNFEIPNIPGGGNQQPGGADGSL